MPASYPCRRGLGHVRLALGRTRSACCWAGLALVVPVAAGCQPSSETLAEAPRVLTTGGAMVGGRATAPGAQTGAESRFAPADYAHHVTEVRQRLNALGTASAFTIVVERPFVVVGNGGREAVQRAARGTVRWATRHLRQRFFEREPERILTIWLFADEASYRTYNRLLFGSEPTTPYGYYSSEHGALVMNIATGGGTLVHELVHPLMEANFPDCPAWFNEGLGSLYEQSTERDGVIVGLVNWRLAGLQMAIAEGTLPSFRDLMHTTSAEFYGRDPGTHYAQARYLLYTLQERGSLFEYYREFRRSVQRDSSGYETLRRVVDERDMDAFQRRWEADVSKLRFP